MLKLTKKNIQAAEVLRDQMLQWNLLHELLTREFTCFKFNTDIHEIGYKIELVDKLYNCQLRQNNRNIANALIDIDLDSEFEKRDPCAVVSKIAEIQLPNIKSGKLYKRLGYVFASKYCHFHYPDKFPIIDSFSKIGLSNLFGKNINYNYTQFMDDINVLKECIEFKITYDQLDTYLWLYGQLLEYKHKNQCSIEFRYLLEHKKDLLEDLPPIEQYHIPIWLSHNYG